jgi:hypothetical protein
MSLPVAAAEWARKGVRGVRRRKPFGQCIAAAVETNRVALAVEAAEVAAEKSAAARAERAAEQERSGGRFAKVAAKKALPPRSIEDRLRAENKFVREKLATVIEEHNASKRRDASSETAELLQQCQAKLEKQEEELRRLRRSVQAFKFRQARAQAAAAAAAAESSKRPRPIGGSSAPIRLKMANELNEYLAARFSSPEHISQALFQHYKRNKHFYTLITTAEIDQNEFDALCSRNPSWCLPIQKALVKEIATHYTLARCLTLQIQCRVGGQKKYQDAINLLGQSENKKMGESGNWLQRGAQRAEDSHTAAEGEGCGNHVPRGDLQREPYSPGRGGHGCLAAGYASPFPRRDSGRADPGLSAKQERAHIRRVARPLWGGCSQLFYSRQYTRVKKFRNMHIVHVKCVHGWILVSMALYVVVGSLWTCSW